MIKGNLYLIPSLLGDTSPQQTLPASVFDITGKLKHYIVENSRSARRFLKKTGTPVPFSEMVFLEIKKHSNDIEPDLFLEPAFSGFDTGLISEAGVPCVADPGSKIVSEAHRKGIKVIPLTGPSSILLALMASGLNGQSFTFHGYLPVKRDDRKRTLQRIEHESRIKNQSQIFIETPYRNVQMFESITEVCSPPTKLCIACDITLESEFIQTKSIAEWGRNKPDINKRPAVFILQNQNTSRG